MNKYWAIIFVTTFLGFCFPVKAQINSTTDGMSGGQTMLNVYMDNARRSAGNGSVTGGNAASAEVQRRTKIGIAKIKAGTATTRFTSSTAVTQRVTKQIIWNADEPQDLFGQTKVLQNYIRRFNGILTENGLTPNDFVDGYVMGYALSYEAYYDRSMNKEDAKNLRNERRSTLLKDAVFQGSPEWDKQMAYELNINMVIQAMDWRLKAKNASSAAERRNADEKAKHFANYLLEVN